MSGHAEFATRVNQAGRSAIPPIQLKRCNGLGSGPLMATIRLYLRGARPTISSRLLRFGAQAYESRSTSTTIMSTPPVAISTAWRAAFCPASVASALLRVA
jgi:hypothetical protein